jgi:hypothetical protein
MRPASTNRYPSADDPQTAPAPPPAPASHPTPDAALTAPRLHGSERHPSNLAGHPTPTKPSHLHTTPYTTSTPSRQFRDEQPHNHTTTSTRWSNKSSTPANRSDCDRDMPLGRIGSVRATHACGRPDRGSGPQPAAANRTVRRRARKPRHHSGFRVRTPDPLPNPRGHTDNPNGCFPSPNRLKRASMFSMTGGVGLRLYSGLT